MLLKIDTRHFCIEWECCNVSLMLISVLVVLRCELHMLTLTNVFTDWGELLWRLKMTMLRGSLNMPGWTACSQPQLTETTAALSYCRAFHTQPWSATFRPERAIPTTPSRKSPSHLQLCSGPIQQPRVEWVKNTAQLQLQTELCSLILKRKGKAKENKMIRPLAVQGHQKLCPNLQSPESFYLGRDFTEYSTLSLAPVSSCGSSSTPIMAHWLVKNSKKWD